MRDSNVFRSGGHRQVCILSLPLVPWRLPWRDEMFSSVLAGVLVSWYLCPWFEEPSSALILGQEILEWRCWDSSRRARRAYSITAYPGLLFNRISYRRLLYLWHLVYWRLYRLLRAPSPQPGRVPYRCPALYEMLEMCFDQTNLLFVICPPLPQFQVLISDDTLHHTPIIVKIN